MKNLRLLDESLGYEKCIVCSDKELDDSDGEIIEALI